MPPRSPFTFVPRIGQAWPDTTQQAAASCQHVRDGLHRTNGRRLLFVAVICISAGFIVRQDRVVAQSPRAAKGSAVDIQFQAARNQAVLLPVDRPTLRRRNVLLLIADDVGVDQVEHYVDYYRFNARPDDEISVTSPCTPTITRLADSGVTFVNAWAYPTCSATRASLYTGTHSFRHEVYSPSDAETFSTDDTTIAEALEDADYTSGLFGKWHLGGEGAGSRPAYHGWQRHAGILGGHLADYYLWEKTVESRSGPFILSRNEDVENYATWENVADAVAWIDEQEGNWMATVAFNAAHTVGLPWTLEDQQPPPGCACTDVGGSAGDAAIYRAVVECLDASIATLLAAIEPAELEQTTIIFIGDNGTDADFADSHFRADRDKGTVYEGGVNVPFVIADGYAYVHDGTMSDASLSTGRVVGPGRTARALVNVVDLFPTIAAIAAADASSGTDAVSLIPILQDTADTVRSVNYVQTATTFAVRSGRHKLIVRGSACELYDMLSDRWEQVDLLSDGISAVEQSIKDSLLADAEAVGRP